MKGKEVATEWIEATATNGDETVVEKTWAAQDVPGGIVKQTITKKKAGKVVTQSTLDVVAVQTGPRREEEVAFGSVGPLPGARRGVQWQTWWPRWLRSSPDHSRRVSIASDLGSGIGQ